MVKLDIGDIRKYTKLMAPLANFDGKYTFYYDETNNIRKFYVREDGFNTEFTDNFVLGGLVHEGEAPDVQPLIDHLKLQSSVKEIKFKHIAKGEFLDCLKSQKLYVLLKFILCSDLYIHYSSLNILYWSIVDIVDSAIAHSEASQQLGLEFANTMKNDLYKLARIEIGKITSLFYKYKYPNINSNEVLSFIEEMSDLFVDYLDDMEFHFGLEALKQILKEARKNGSLPFIMEEEDFMLIKDFSQLYLRPVYLFKNSQHIFDNEDLIVELLSEYKLTDGAEQINNYTFVDSKLSRLTQLSDVIVGLFGKLSSYLNTNRRDQIQSDFSTLEPLQRSNINLLLKSIDRSHHKNMGFLHTIDSYEEMSKIELIRGCLL